MAHKKGAGSTKNGRDSNAKRLGVKRFGFFVTNCCAVLYYFFKYYNVTIKKKMKDHVEISVGSRTDGSDED